MLNAVPVTRVSKCVPAARNVRDRGWCDYLLVDVFSTGWKPVSRWDWAAPSYHRERALTFSPEGSGSPLRCGIEHLLCPACPGSPHVRPPVSPDSAQTNSNSLM